MKARISVASVAAVLVLAAAVVSIAASPAFAASCGNGQGQALLIGCDNNSATDDTYLSTSRSGGTALLLTATGPGSTTGLSASGSATGVFGGGDTGVYGVGGTNGVVGFGTLAGSVGVSGTGTTGVSGTGGTGVSGTGDIDASSVGVFGDNTTHGNGVYGHTNSSFASGVYGQNDGTGLGVAGRAPTGTGVLGDSHDGVGVTANSVFGTALQVNGKATFSRSGVVTVPAGKKSLTVPLELVTTSSMVLATAQQSKTVSVKAATPATGSFKIFLTGNAPEGGLKVAYFVLN